MPSKGVKVLAQNRKARHDYFVLETLETGLALFGTEVKSMRAGRCNLKDCYAQVKDGELWVFGMHISPYEYTIATRSGPKSCWRTRRRYANSMRSRCRKV